MSCQTYDILINVLYKKGKENMITNVHQNQGECTWNCMQKKGFDD